MTGYPPPDAPTRTPAVACNPHLPAAAACARCPGPAGESRDPAGRPRRARLGPTACQDGLRFRALGGKQSKQQVRRQLRILTLAAIVRPSATGYCGGDGVMMVFGFGFGGLVLRPSAIYVDGHCSATSKLLATFLRCFASKLARAPHAPLRPYLQRPPPALRPGGQLIRRAFAAISPTTFPRSGPRATRNRDDPAAAAVPSDRDHAPRR